MNNNNFESTKPSTGPSSHHYHHFLQSLNRSTVVWPGEKANRHNYYSGRSIVDRPPSALLDNRIRVEPPGQAVNGSHSSSSSSSSSLFRSKLTAMALLNSTAGSLLAPPVTTTISPTINGTLSPGLEIQNLTNQFNIDSTLDYKVIYDNDSDDGGQYWSNTEMPILAGAAVGGILLMSLIIIVLLVWHCCDWSGNEKNNYSIGGNSGRSGSIESSGKRSNCSLYINNPNSIDTGYQYDCGQGEEQSIPRSLSVPLSRSNSRKDQQADIEKSSSQRSNSYFASSNKCLLECGLTDSIGGSKSQLSRNIIAYYETQKNSNNNSNGDSNSGSRVVCAVAGSKKSSVSTDLSLNMDIVDYQNNVNNVILEYSSQAGWPPDAHCGDEMDFFAKTKSLPWRNGKARHSVSESTASTECATGDDHSSLIPFDRTTTIGRVNFTKKRRNRMRNDTAAAIALNRSGYLGASGDLDGPLELHFQPDNHCNTTTTTGANGLIACAEPPPPLTPPVASSVGESDSLKQTTQASQNSPDSNSSDQFILNNEAVVVYNERTVL